MNLLNYYSAYNDYFWQWEEDGEYISIPDNMTIAHRKVVSDLVGALIPNGLPPFGSLLLAILALDGGEASIVAAYDYSMQGDDTIDNGILLSAAAFLRLLSQVPSQYKTGMRRAMLFQAIFENCHNKVSVKGAQKFYDFLAADTFSSKTLVRDMPVPESLLRKDYRTIALLNKRFKTVKDIIDSIALLPAAPEIDEKELKPEDDKESGPKDFIDELAEDSRTFYVGALVRRLWSGLNIPFHTAQPGRQPMGGVSDLSNKGDFDKLLISEYANEDLVFLSRLANNEALFLNREMPPLQNDMRRVLLIDSSLKNWGTPKTIAFATAIALARHPKNKMQCDTHAVGKNYTPVSINDIDGVVDGLAMVDRSLHASEGLEAYFNENKIPSGHEVFFITEASALKQPEMLRVFHENKSINYWILTDSEGNLDIYKKQQRSKKHIQHLQLPIKELWSQRPKQKNTRESREPLSTTTPYIPLLFKTPMKERAMLFLEDDIFLITPDNMLFKMYRRSDQIKQNGWELLNTRLPIGQMFEIGRNKEGDLILLVYNYKDQLISLLNVDTHERVTTTFKHDAYFAPPEIMFFDKHFYFKGKDNEVLRIHMDGRREPSDTVTNKHFEARKRDLNKQAEIFQSRRPIFRNIYEVYINGNDKLVFNIHELTILRNKQLRLEKTERGIMGLRAAKEDNTFSFPDGSIIEVLSAGALILKSSNNGIPLIYVTSAISTSLAMATDDVFAGNAFYNRSLPVIDTDEFYERYVEAFILNIKQNTLSK